MTKVVLALVSFCLVFSTQVNSRGKEQEVAPPLVYKEKAIKMLDGLVGDSAKAVISPLDENEHDDFRRLLRSNDKFKYDPVSELKIVNKDIHIDLRDPGIPVIKIGHTFTTTLIFTDALGNPWSVKTLTDISNTEVVSVSEKGPNMITVRPMKLAGKTNLPIKLQGEQRIVTFLFDIVDDEVYFDVNVKVDGLGDAADSQQSRSMNEYSQGMKVAPKLNLDPAIELMTQMLTPDGYKQRRVFNESRQPADERDFVAWSKDNLLYVLTPHGHYYPEPIDVVASDDGRSKLLVFEFLPLIAMKKGTQVHWLHIE